MSKLISMQRPLNGKKESNGCSCEACGKSFESTICLTNLSSSPMQTYNACPFCFSKLGDIISEESSKQELSTSEEHSTTLWKDDNAGENAGKMECPHHFGYLKKRPKNAPIPDTCLMCQKMIQCLL